MESGRSGGGGSGRGGNSARDRDGNPFPHDDYRQPENNPRLLRSQSMPGVGFKSRKKGYPLVRCDKKDTFSKEAIPGYKGYQPGVKAETLSSGLFSTILEDSKHATRRKAHNEQSNIREKNAARTIAEAGGVPAVRVATRDEILQELDNKRGDDDLMTGYVPCAGDYRESRILNSYESYYEEPFMENTLKAKTNIVK